MKYEGFFRSPDLLLDKKKYQVSVQLQLKDKEGYQKLPELHPRKVLAMTVRYRILISDI